MPRHYSRHRSRKRCRRHERDHDRHSDRDLFSPFKRKRYALNRGKRKRSHTADSDEACKCKVNAEEYNMCHIRRGRAIIFNHCYCHGHPVPRRGTEKDVVRLEKTLADCLKFEVCVYTDLSHTEIQDTLCSLSQEQFDDEDCLAIFVLTHGSLNKLTAQDETYPIEELWQYFTPDKCCSLAGKPKLFFINACRGKKFDEGVIYTEICEQLETPGPSAKDCKTTTSFRIPIFADFLTFYSTMEGFISVRHALDGTWFIQAFCETIENEDYRKLELKELLTVVARKTALKCNEYGEAVCQIPTLMSTLIRNLYFSEKEF